MSWWRGAPARECIPRARRLASLRSSTTQSSTSSARSRSFRFLPVAEEEIPEAISDGTARRRVDRAIPEPVRAGRDESGFAASAQLPASAGTRVPSSACTRINTDSSSIRGGDALVASFAIPEGLAWEVPFLHLRIPTALVKAVGNPAVLVLTADRPLRGVDEVRASCEGPAAPVASTQDGAEMRVELCRSQAPFVELWLSRSGTGPPVAFRGAKLVRAAQRGRE